MKAARTSLRPSLDRVWLAVFTSEYKQAMEHLRTTELRTTYEECVAIAAETADAAVAVLTRKPKR